MTQNENFLAFWRRTCHKNPALNGNDKLLVTPENLRLLCQSFWQDGANNAEPGVDALRSMFGMKL